MSVIFGKLNKRRMASILLALFLVLPVIVILIATDSYVTVSGSADIFPLLIIDAGHGGLDSGAIAADGTKESELNLAIALKIRAIAELYGIENCLLRQGDNTLSDSQNYSEHRDLERRTEIVNSKENCVYLSIHQNCYPTGQPSGSLVIYSSESGSEAFGKLTHDSLIKQLNPNNRRMAEPADNKYYILSHVNCPAILVECGFMSNFSEMEKLKTSNYQSSISAVLMGSFIQYVQNSRYI